MEGLLLRKHSEQQLIEKHSHVLLIHFLEAIVSQALLPLDFALLDVKDLLALYLLHIVSYLVVVEDPPQVELIALVD